MDLLFSSVFLTVWQIFIPNVMLIRDQFGSTFVRTILEIFCGKLQLLERFYRVSMSLCG